MNRIIGLFSLATLLSAAPFANATDCSDCKGDVGVKKTKAEFWGESKLLQYYKHVHDFGALCDAFDLADFTGEVAIMIAVSADLDGSTKYVTATFVSGTVRTAITSGNGFANAPSDGKFFKDYGTTACGGELDRSAVFLDYDGFNALLDAGDGTMKIEVNASEAVENLCTMCCNPHYSWTPDECCDNTPPCGCPPAATSKTEVTLVYLDCAIIGDDFCVTDEDCEGKGDTNLCNGPTICDTDTGVCIEAGNPCPASEPICLQFSDPCIPPDEPEDCYQCSNCEADIQCEELDSIFCNGHSKCINGDCESATSPACLPFEVCYEDIDACIGCQ